MEAVRAGRGSLGEKTVKLRHLTSDVRIFLNNALEAPELEPVKIEASDKSIEKAETIEETSEVVGMEIPTDNEILEQLNAATALWKDNGKFETGAISQTSWTSKIKEQFNKLKPKTEVKQSAPEIPVSKVFDLNANNVEWNVIFAHLEQLKASERDEIEELYRQILED